jgi:hypothetical protein
MDTFIMGLALIAFFALELAWLVRPYDPSIEVESDPSTRGLASA